MTEIINLNKKRKAKAKIEDKRKASENRVKFGRTKEQKQLEKAKSKLAEKHIDAHKIDTKED